MNTGNIRVMLAAANPRGTNHLHLDEEVRRIESQLALSAQSLKLASGKSECREISLRALWAAQLTDLVRDMTAFAPSVVHFSGHGEGEKGLLMTDGEGRPASISGQALQLIFAEFTDTVRLVVLNACYSHIQAEALCQKIDAVIGMKAGITDRGAILFAASLYSQLALGSSIGRAFRLAKSIIAAQCPDDAEIPCLLCGAEVDPDRIYLGVQEADSKKESGWRTLLASNATTQAALRQAINLALPNDADLEAFVSDLREDPRYARILREWSSDMRRQRKLNLLFDYGPPPNEMREDLLGFIG